MFPKNDIYHSAGEAKASPVFCFKCCYAREVRKTGEKAKSKINKAYWEAKNSVSGSAGQSRLEFNERAAASGLGSGVHERGLAAIDRAERERIEKLERQRIDSVNEVHRALGEDEEAYSSAVRDALLCGDTQSAQELYDEHREKKAGLERLKELLEGMSGRAR